MRELDHTADLGIRVRGETLPELFDRAAQGMFRLVHEPSGAGRSADGRNSGPRTEPTGSESALALEAPDLPGLLVKWLSELVYLQGEGSLRYLGAHFDDLGHTGLRARVRWGSCAPPAVREIKGVTYHDLEVRRGADGWIARVIFDV